MLPFINTSTLRTNMKLVKGLGLISFALTLNGCTVLGFATDMVLSPKSDGNQKPGTSTSGNGTELIFTQEGIKHDVKVVKNLIEELSEHSHDVNPVFQKNQQTKALACKKVSEGKQQCYAPEYYKDIYIEHITSKKQQTNSSQ
ncbi:MAG: hypothetical protein ACI8Y3_001239 [Paraglaciecola sp.]|jgi:hypothetical protein